jgi:hypothetical protein
VIAVHLRAVVLFVMEPPQPVRNAKNKINGIRGMFIAASQRDILRFCGHGEP